MVTISECTGPLPRGIPFPGFVPRKSFAMTNLPISAASREAAMHLSLQPNQETVERSMQRVTLKGH